MLKRRIDWGTIICRTFCVICAVLLLMEVSKLQADLTAQKRFSAEIDALAQKFSGTQFAEDQIVLIRLKDWNLKDLRVTTEWSFPPNGLVDSGVSREFFTIYGDPEENVIRPAVEKATIMRGPEYTAETFTTSDLSLVADKIRMEANSNLADIFASWRWQQYRPVILAVKVEIN